MTNHDFSPYYRNGKLYLPHKTVQLLIDAGLDECLAQAALNGLALDERDHIARIHQALEQALQTMEEDSQEFRALTSEETQFILTGRTAGF